MKWKVVKLGDILNFRRGHDLPHSKMASGNIPVAGSNGIIGYHNVPTPMRPVLTIGRSGNTGKPFYYEEAWAHNTTLYVDDFKGNNPKFLYYLCQTLPFANFEGGSAVPTLNRNHIHLIETRIPENLNDQRRIASILSSLDRKIEINNQINARLEEIAQALFKSWLESCNESKTLGDLSINVADYTKCTADKVILINSSDVTEGYFEHCILTENIDLKGHFKKRFQKGDILYSQVRPRNRHWAICQFDADNYIASTQLMVIRNNRKYVSNVLLYQYLISTDVWKQYTLKTETRSGTFPQGNYEDLSTITVRYGTNNEQISAQLKAIYDKCYSNYLENRHLASLRDTLLPKLMSGEIKIKA